ncbi:MAG: ABC transporter ATP-binding protein, partial [Alphaproteobacteria bacterium]|nr:ABC transporter ATP-binding protein [Alphaproteobacteria bacterium]
MADPIIRISGLNKIYEGGMQALFDVSLDVEAGEILALLGPNGAGKTSLISAICGLTRPSSGTILVSGFDVVKDFRATRQMIGLVPQEITLEPFETVFNTVSFTRGLFGKKADPAWIETVLDSLSLLDKKDSKVMTLSGGMKRRVLIAKALSHAPKILFLDEPTAGVDVELRQDMWALVETLRQRGTTIILTTHYIEEAEAIADRIGIINRGRLLLVEEKDGLLRRMGSKQLHIELQAPISRIPDALANYDLALSREGMGLVYSYDVMAERTGIVSLLGDLGKAGLVLRDLRTEQSSLEDIFV